MSSGENGGKSTPSTTLKATAAEFVPKGFPLKPTAAPFVPAAAPTGAPTTNSAPTPTTAPAPVSIKTGVILPNDDDDDDIEFQFGDLNIDNTKTSTPAAPTPAVAPPPVTKATTNNTVAPPKNLSVKVDEPKVEKQTSNKDESKPNTPKDTFDKKPQNQTPNKSNRQQNDISQAKSGWGRGLDNGHNNQHPSRGLSLQKPQEPVNKGDDGGWKRGEMVKGLSLIGRQDGVKRYDRATLVSLFEKGNTSPECMSTFYPSFCNEERSPKSVKPIKGKQKKEVEIDPEDSKEFRKGLEDENVFKYIPGRLENAEDTATIVSKAKAILNKLTPEKFEKLAQDFMNVGLKNSRALLDKAVETIVSKAQMEENFCFMYADLCVKLMNEWTDPMSLLKDESNSNEENSEKADEEGMSQGKFFRNLILHRCSHEFDIDREKALEEIQNRDISEEDKLEQAILLKKRYTGHMRFIGEMYVKKMISHGIMHNCITDLLKGNNEEETLVCLCKLMETIGSKLEQHEIIKKKKKKATDPPEENSIDMQSHFEEIQIISKEHPSSRIRFMMKDLIELRENNWQSRRQAEKPKTLEEIRAEAEKEQGGSGKSTPRVPSGNLGPRSFSSSDNLTQDARNQQGFRRMNSAPNQPNSPRQGGQPIHRTNSTGNIINKSNNGNEKKEWKGGESKWGNKQNSDTKGSSKNNDLHKAPALTRQESLESDYLDVDASQPGFDGQVSKDVLKKLKPILEEYLAGLTDVEAVQEINDLIHANGMGDVIKSSFLFVVDKKDTDRDAILQLLLCLHSSKLLSKTVAVKGMYGILDDFDDCIIDSPLIGLYLAKLLAGLVTNDVLDLNFLGQIPEDNNFAASTRAADFIIATLSEIEKVKGEEVINIFKETNIKILQLVNATPRQTPEQVFEEIATKYKISTSLKSSILS